MPDANSAVTPARFSSFGELLKFLRRRAGLSQRELSIAVGYSEAQISRLERNERAPDTAILAARFVEALNLDKEKEWTARLLQLGAESRAEREPKIEASHAAPASHNLPIQFTSFIGREQELAELKSLLRTLHEQGAGRLLTLTGAGGSGKTRLALRVAAESVNDFPDGVWFVNLAPITDAELVIPSILQTLRVSVLGNQPPLDALKEYLREKKLLLVLDNFEQIVDAAPALTLLLVAAPGLTLLVTSRVVLHLSGEQEFLVPPLPIPELHSATVDALARNEAVALFVQRAKVTRKDFQLTDANASAVAQICVRLDGLPLAIELAAARCKVLAPNDLLARLSSRLGLLTGGARDVPARQRTLRNTIDWSYQLLKPEEQRLFERLGVFAGSWSLDAAEQVCNAERDIPGDLAVILNTLLDQNLIRQIDSGGEALRFGMLETLREYALEQLEASGEVETLRENHAEYYLAFVNAAFPPTYAFYPALEMHERIATDRDNLRAAFAWSQRTRGNAEMGLRLSLAIMNLSNVTEERIWTERALARAEAEGGYDPKTHARVLMNLASHQALQGDYTGAESRYLKGLDSFRQLGDKFWSVQALERVGWAAREQGNTTTAYERLKEALAGGQELNHLPLIVGVKTTLGETLIMQGELLAAHDLLEEVAAIDPPIGESRGWALNHLGHIAQIEEKYDDARRLHEESLSIFRAKHAPWSTAEALYSLGETALGQDDTTRASEQLLDSLASCKQMGYLAGIAWCLAGLAGTAVVDEEPERAAFLWGASEALRQRIGTREGPASHDLHARLMAEARQELGDELFDKMIEQGAAAPIEQVVAQILSETR